MIRSSPDGIFRLYDPSLLGLGNVPTIIQEQYYYYTILYIM